MGHATADYQLRWKVWLAKGLMGVMYVLYAPIFLWSAAMAIFLGLFAAAGVAYVAWWVFQGVTDALGHLLLAL